MSISVTLVLATKKEPVGRRFLSPAGELLDLRRRHRESLILATVSGVLRGGAQKPAKHILLHPLSSRALRGGVPRILPTKAELAPIRTARAPRRRSKPSKQSRIYLVPYARPLTRPPWRRSETYRPYVSLLRLRARALRGGAPKPTAPTFRV